MDLKKLNWFQLRSISGCFDFDDDLANHARSLNEFLCIDTTCIFLFVDRIMMAPYPIIFV